LGLGSGPLLICISISFFYLVLKRIEVFLKVLEIIAKIILKMLQFNPYCYQRRADRSEKGSHGINDAVNSLQMVQDSWVYSGKDLFNRKHGQYSGQETK